MFKDIKDLFLNRHGKYIKMLQFESLVIIVSVIFILTYYFPKTYGFVIMLIVFSIYVSDNYVTVNNATTDNFNNITMVKLENLQNKVNEYIANKLSKINNLKLQSNEMVRINEINDLDSLYMDANMIHFLDSILPLYKYNAGEFYLLLKGTNNIMKIQKEIDEFYDANEEYPGNINEMLEMALDLRSKTINNMHNFIYSIPKIKVMNDYLNKVTNRYSTLISRITDSIHNSYKKNIELRGINVNTKFLSYNTTKPFDAELNHSMIANKGNNVQKLVQFYI